MVWSPLAVGLHLSGSRRRRAPRSDVAPTMGLPRMDEPLTRRLCDGLTGAASVSALAGFAPGSLAGGALCGGVAVIAQLLRGEAKA